MAALHDFLFRICIYGRAPNGLRGSRSRLSINPDSGNEMDTIISVTHGKKNVIVATSYDHNEWFVATIEKIIIEAPQVKSFFFKTPRSLTHLAGQHYELRLTAVNGYQAARLYSAATAGDGGSILQLTIMEVLDGEVSPYVVKSLKVGDKVEIRGPFGHFFVWSPSNTRPVLLVGGGSGVIPMYAMFMAHQTSGSTTPMKLLYGTRHYEDILYKDALVNADNVTIALSQEISSDWQGLKTRIDEAIVRDILNGLDSPLCYVCGMSPFVDVASSLLLELGVPIKDIFTERFG